MDEQIKVDYACRVGGTSTAYIDEDTGIGTDKHTDVAVRLERRSGGGWAQVDDWEWDFRPFDGAYRVSDGLNGYQAERLAATAAHPLTICMACALVGRVVPVTVAASTADTTGYQCPACGVTVWVIHP